MLPKTLTDALQIHNLVSNTPLGHVYIPAANVVMVLIYE